MIPLSYDEDTTIIVMNLSQFREEQKRLLEGVLSIMDEKIRTAILDAKATEFSDAGLVYGVEDIAKVIGCNKNSLYARMNDNPKLAAAVKHVGSKRVARRDDLIDAIMNPPTPDEPTTSQTDEP